MIERRLYPEHDLVVHTVTGELEEEELLAVGVALYEPALASPGPTCRFPSV